MPQTFSHTLGEPPPYSRLAASAFLAFVVAPIFLMPAGDVPHDKLYITTSSAILCSFILDEKHISQILAFIRKIFCVTFAFAAGISGSYIISFGGTSISLSQRVQRLSENGVNDLVVLCSVFLIAAAFVFLSKEFLIFLINRVIAYGGKLHEANKELASNIVKYGLAIFAMGVLGISAENTLAILATGG